MAVVAQSHPGIIMSLRKACKKFKGEARSFDISDQLSMKRKSLADPYADARRPKRKVIQELKQITETGDDASDRNVLMVNHKRCYMCKKPRPDPSSPLCPPWLLRCRYHQISCECSTAISKGSRFRGVVSATQSLFFEPTGSRFSVEIPELRHRRTAAFGHSN